MKDRLIGQIVGRPESRSVAFDSLMVRRVYNILLVSSPYDLFTIEEDGRLTESLYSDYLELNLRQTPYIERVTTAEEALQEIKNSHYDLIISMLKIGDMDLNVFGRRVREIKPDLPIILLAYNTRELALLDGIDQSNIIDRCFVWLGDSRIFLAIVKYVEDRLNVKRDVHVADVQCILLIEDNIRFYSSYLPMLYTELVAQTQNLMSDALNNMDRLLRMRARPKILLATTYEEGEELLEKYKNNFSGVILDAHFPRRGVIDADAGVNFAKMVRKELPDRPVIMQSSDENMKDKARKIGAHFINKNSPRLLHDLQEFMSEHMGFGAFVFRMPDGKEVGRATGLRALAQKLRKIPTESLVYHSNRNDFSTWLMARTEFDIARRLRPHKVSESLHPEETRSYLVSALEAHRGRSRAGIVADFATGTFEPTSGFSRIGKGSLGGKGRGLAFVHSLIERFQISQNISGLRISIPPTCVLCTSVFDEFMRGPNLNNLALSPKTSDKQIRTAFLDSPLPTEVRASLATFLSRADYPIAVRSSSLLEDASYQPFAGIYSTFMLPNNHEKLDIRVLQLETAIKLVYASTYSSNARNYIESTPNRLEEEKMAVIIQRVVGRRSGEILYPDIAGVGRSHNFYPMEGMQHEDGVASVVLGLGKSVVEGGRTVRFSPAHPSKLYQFSNVEDTLRTAQREFLALDMSDPDPDMNNADEQKNIVTCGLDVAATDGVLNYVGSVYSPENNCVYDGTSRPGVPLVTMSGVLKADAYPLAEALNLMLKLGNAAFSAPVEIEFAATISNRSDEPNEFHFLQIRPVVVNLSTTELSLDKVDPSNAICISHAALGHGTIDNIRDVVYVPKATFDRSNTAVIAQEIGTITSRIHAEGREILLIGPGRWGTSDLWLGIPVSWQQIQGVKCIVETDMEDIHVSPSEGSHFFQNITSFGIGYFTVNSASAQATINLEWLDAIESQTETAFVRHLSFESPLSIAIDGRQGIGVILKSGYSFLDSTSQRKTK